MATSEQTKRSTETKEKIEKKPYEPPAIVHEGVVSTRTGSPPNLTGEDGEPGVDPADLFGSGG
jgi:hypothetical protein